MQRRNTRHSFALLRNFKIIGSENDSAIYCDKIFCKDLQCQFGLAIKKQTGVQRIAVKEAQKTVICRLLGSKTSAKAAHASEIVPKAYSKNSETEDRN
jgi:hypothetical protein